MKKHSHLFWLLAVTVIAAIGTTAFLLTRPIRPIPFDRKLWIDMSNPHLIGDRLGMALWLKDNYPFCGKTHREIVREFVYDETLDDWDHLYWNTERMIYDIDDFNRTLTIPLEIVEKKINDSLVEITTDALKIGYDKRLIVREAYIERINKRSLDTVREYICRPVPIEAYDPDDTTQLKRAPRAMGIGTLHIGVVEPMPIYRTEFDSLPFDTLRPATQEDGSGIVATERMKTLTPFFYHNFTNLPENFMMSYIEYVPLRIAFRVLEATDKFFRVVTDEDLFETAVVLKKPEYQLVETVNWDHIYKCDPNHNVYIYETWSGLLKRCRYVKLTGNYEVCDQPSGKVLFTVDAGSYLDNPSYKVIDMEDDWMHVKLRYDHGKDSIWRDAVGWIRWNDRVNLTVDFVEYVSY